MARPSRLEARLRTVCRRRVFLRAAGLARSVLPALGCLRLLQVCILTMQHNEVKNYRAAGESFRAVLLTVVAGTLVTSRLRDAAKPDFVLIVPHFLLR